MITYVAPLIFVLTVTMMKEAWDDINRKIRDRKLNLTKYEAFKSTAGKFVEINSKDIKVG